MRLAGVDWQGKDVIGENYNLDLIPLGVSGLRYKRTWTLYIFFLAWCFTVTGETRELDAVAEFWKNLFRDITKKIEKEIRFWKASF